MTEKLQEKIIQIESKIKQTQSTLTNWTHQIETYQNNLKNLIQQLNSIKKSLNKK